MCVNHTDRSMACSCLSPSLLSSLFPAVSLCVSLSVPSAFTSLMLLFFDIPHLHKHAQTHTRIAHFPSLLRLPRLCRVTHHNRIQQATVHWPSDPSALLSQLGTVNATQKYMRDLNIDLALSLKKREAETVCLHLSLYVNVPSVFSTAVKS